MNEPIMDVTINGEIIITAKDGLLDCKLHGKRESVLKMLIGIFVANQQFIEDARQALYIADKMKEDMIKGELDGNKLFHVSEIKKGD